MDDRSLLKALAFIALSGICWGALAMLIILKVWMR